MKKRLLSWLQTLALFVIIIAGINAWRTQEVPAQAPDFTAQYDDGSSLSLSTFRASHADKPIAIVFWAEWCPICKTEEHSINRLAHDPNTPILIIATQSGSAAQVQSVLKERQLDWRVVMDENGQLLQSFELYGVPSFVVVDNKDKIHFSQMGYTSELGMRTRIWLAHWL